MFPNPGHCIDTVRLANCPSLYHNEGCPVNHLHHLEEQMPSLIRLVIVLAIIGALVYGAMVSLALFVEPNPREMSIKIKSERLNR